MTELVVPDDQWNNFVKDRMGAIAGARTAARFHWKIGDRIPIKTLSTAAALRSSTSTAFITATSPAATRASSGCSGNILTRMRPLRSRAPRDGTWSSSIVPMTPCPWPRPLTKSLAIRPLRRRPKPNPRSPRVRQQFGNIELLILTIGGVVFFTLLLVTGNTMAISVRERVGELAVLKAIGFSGRAVLFFVLAESIIIAFVGGVLGLTLAYLLIPVIGIALPVSCHL